MIQKLLAILLFAPAGLIAGFENMESGIYVNKSNINEIAQTSYEYAYASETQIANDDGFARTFLRVNGSDDLYSLSTSKNIYLTDFDTREINGNWPLTRWKKYDELPLVNLHFGNISFIEGKPFEQEVIGTGAGCHGDTPLRYGDIDGDGEGELVVELNGLLLFFSPKHERIIFSTRVKFHDYISDSMMVEQYADLDESTAQNISMLATLNKYDEWIPGARSYAKIFDGDFNNDGHPDLLVWQKGFKSNLNSNPIIGFGLVESSWVHFERDLTAQAESETGVTGEYLPQETSENDIKNWLSENSLTWSKGYPSLSECAGEEGQLIPEMHDPLLNDPEVLQ